MRGLAVLAVLLTLAGSAAARVATARVSIVATSPVTVRGSGFVPRERVAVTVSAKTSSTKSVVASASGTFVVRFLHFTIARCTPYGVSAKGNRGSRASWKIAPMCAPLSPTGGTTTTEPQPGYPTDPVPKKKP